MFNLVIAILAAASTVSSEAPATEAATAANTEATSTEKAVVPQEQPVAKPKKICRRIESETGSRTGGGKLCKTAEGWKKYYGR